MLSIQRLFSFILLEWKEVVIFKERNNRWQCSMILLDLVIWLLHWAGQNTTTVSMPSNARVTSLSLEVARLGQQIGSRHRRQLNRAFTIVSSWKINIRRYQYAALLCRKMCWYSSILVQHLPRFSYFVRGSKPVLGVVQLGRCCPCPGPLPSSPSWSHSMCAAFVVPSSFLSIFLLLLSPNKFKIRSKEKF